MVNFNWASLSNATQAQEWRRCHLYACFQYWFKSIRPSHYRRPCNEYDPLQDCPATAVEMNSRRIFQQLSIGATVTVSSSVGIAEAQRRSLDPLAESGTQELVQIILEQLMDDENNQAS
ncbi:unnamed protein product [Camellia sinensis]